ncbi:flagellar FliJ protein [Aequitasia blattaphilus]|uniref:Flagellar FliJ protein n=1 Tax=Aequitasia blattaphilus TaxID=2949332 RepID=A0ABT1E9L4_9FIRM|nr:flagellar export protein FliJ [Aequitasia blattaphilus]MCP1102507.1 flagellar export protein FliJ [Aequitasia blattaphilus]MCR8615147.1 flagellar export protein FliJ [Aequitasia blattaphilus]
MKKFTFALDKVLRYKRQIERNLRNEHAYIVQEINQQEKVIEDLEKEYDKLAHEFEEIKQVGATVKSLRVYEDYFNTLRQSIIMEEQLLHLLRQKEAQKRKEVITAKQETSSIDILKDKRKEEYTKELRKNEERELEEFVASTMHQAKGA